MDFEAAGTSEAASTLKCLRQRILSTVSQTPLSPVTESESRCQIRLVTSNFGTSSSNGTICVLFDDSCSYDDGNTLSSSLIDNRQFETALHLYRKKKKGGGS